VVAALARRVRRPEADLLEAWEERAAVREFEGGQRRVSAEADALDDVRQRYEPQRRLM
jgi:hypothetical protein